MCLEHLPSPRRTSGTPEQWSCQLGRSHIPTPRTLSQLLGSPAGQLLCSLVGTLQHRGGQGNKARSPGSHKPTSSPPFPSPHPSSLPTPQGGSCIALVTAGVLGSKACKEVAEPSLWAPDNLNPPVCPLWACLPQPAHLALNKNH